MDIHPVPVLVVILAVGPSVASLVVEAKDTVLKKDKKDNNKSDKK